MCRCYPFEKRVTKDTRSTSDRVSADQVGIAPQVNSSLGRRRPQQGGGLWQQHGERPKTDEPVFAVGWREQTREGTATRDLRTLYGMGKDGIFR